MELSLLFEGMRNVLTYSRALHQSNLSRDLKSHPHLVSAVKWRRNCVYLFSETTICTVGLAVFQNQPVFRAIAYFNASLLAVNFLWLTVLVAKTIKIESKNHSEEERLKI